MSSSFERTVPEHIRRLAAYQPGKPVEELERELGISGAIKIASNENPLGPSPLAIAAARDAVESVNFYPDGGCYRLRRTLSERLGVAPEQLIFGAGCNEIIHMIVMALCQPGGDEVLSHKYAFISYKLAAAARNVRFVETPVTETLRADVDALIEKMSERTKVIFLANPNNPTGSHLTRDELERVIAARPADAVLVIDEAYHEYARVAFPDYPSSQAYLERDDKILTLRTFSKAYGLAGMRVGYGIGDATLIDYLGRVRRPFNVSLVAQAAAEAALDDSDHIERSTRAAASGIEALRATADSLGLTAYPSLGNFVLIDIGRPAAEAYDALLRKGVIVRPMAAWGLPNCIRVSIGAPKEMERVTAAFKELYG